MKLQDSISQAELQLASIKNFQPNTMSFDWQGISFEASIQTLHNGSYTLQLHANLGRLYYTVENGSHRTTAIKHLFRSNREIDGAYSITEKGCVHFNSLTTFNEKLMGNELLTAVTTIVIQAEPHLRTLKSFLSPIKLTQICQNTKWA